MCIDTDGSETEAESIAQGRRTWLRRPSPYAVDQCDAIVGKEVFCGKALRSSEFARFRLCGSDRAGSARFRGDVVDLYTADRGAEPQRPEQDGGRVLRELATASTPLRRYAASAAACRLPRLGTWLRVNGSAWRLSLRGGVSARSSDV